MNEREILSPVEVKVLQWLATFIIVGFAVVLWVVPDFRNTFIAVLWALACLAVGHLIGFLFGIPRVVKVGPSPAYSNGSTTNGVTPSSVPLDSSPYQVNTNLQDISDWLTKIIVGLGLVQLSKAYTHLQTAAQFISGSLGSGTTAVSGGIIVYFTIIGFLGGYITTRLFLGTAFVKADRFLSASEKQQVEVAVINVDDVDGSFTPKTKVIAEKIANIPWKFVKVTEVPIWAKAKLIVREIRDAVEAYRYLVRVEPNNILFRLNLSQALFENGERESALKQVKEALALVDESTPRDLVEACYKAVVYFSLYIQPDGYKDAITYSDRFRALPGKQLTAPMWVNLAAAYGQQASKEPAVFAVARNNALDASRKAIEMDPVWKGKLKEMLKPTSDAEDDDLVIFKNDPDFENLLE